MVPGSRERAHPPRSRGKVVQGHMRCPRSHGEMPQATVLGGPGQGTARQGHVRSHLGGPSCGAGSALQPWALQDSTLPRSTCTAVGRAPRGITGWQELRPPAGRANPLPAPFSGQQWGQLWGWGLRAEGESVQVGRPPRRHWARPGRWGAGPMASALSVSPWQGPCPTPSPFAAPFKPRSSPRTGETRAGAGGALLPEEADDPETPAGPHLFCTRHS